VRVERLVPVSESVPVAPAASRDRRSRSRFLLVQRGRYLSSHRGGGQKANRRLLEALVADGHDCRAWTVLQGPGGDERDQLRADLGNRGIRPAAEGSGRLVFSCGGVLVQAVASSSSLQEELVREIETWRPTWVLVSEDWTLSLLERCAGVSPHTVWIDHSPVRLPLGPFMPREREQRVLGSAAGIVTRSQFHRGHLLRRLGLESFVFHFPVYGSRVPARCGSPSNRYVTMINPSVIKGIDVFIGLARRFSAVDFAAVTSWATTSRDRQQLEQEVNVTLLEPTEDLDRIFSESKVLLVPSRWQEAFGQVVVDAMLRGVPVIASDAGGLPESKLGVEFLVPVAPIEGYREQLDDRGVPVPVAPPVDLEPWVGPLEELTQDEGRYREVAEASRSAAIRHWQGLSLDPLYRFLDRVDRRLPAEGSPEDGTSAR
jgi:glycosyltransferase involved in cell wall biosynthesis